MSGNPARKRKNSETVLSDEVNLQNLATEFRKECAGVKDVRKIENILCEFRRLSTSSSVLSSQFLSAMRDEVGKAKAWTQSQLEKLWSLSSFDAFDEKLWRIAQQSNQMIKSLLLSHVAVLPSRGGTDVWSSMGAIFNKPSLAANKLMFASLQFLVDAAGSGDHALKKWVTADYNSRTIALIFQLCRKLKMTLIVYSIEENKDNAPPIPELRHYKGTAAEKLSHDQNKIVLGLFYGELFLLLPHNDSAAPIECHVSVDYVLRSVSIVEFKPIRLPNRDGYGMKTEEFTEERTIKLNAEEIGGRIMFAGPTHPVTVKEFEDLDALARRFQSILRQWGAVKLTVKDDPAYIPSQQQKDLASMTFEFVEQLVSPVGSSGPLHTLVQVGNPKRKAYAEAKSYSERAVRDFRESSTFVNPNTLDFETNSYNYLYAQGESLSPMTESMIMNTILNSPHNHFDKLPGNFPGINTAYDYFATGISYAACHLEDNILFSLNIGVFGGPKLWFVIPTSETYKFEAWHNHQLAKANLKLPCPNYFQSKCFVPEPTKIDTSIPVVYFEQGPHEIMLINTATYHMVQNIDVCVNVAINFPAPDWTNTYHFQRFCRHDRLEGEVVSKDQTLINTTLSGCNEINPLGPTSLLCWLCEEEPVLQYSHLPSLKHLQKNKCPAINGKAAQEIIELTCILGREARPGTYFVGGGKDRVETADEMISSEATANTCSEDDANNLSVDSGFAKDQQQSVNDTTPIHVNNQFPADLPNDIELPGIRDDLQHPPPDPTYAEQSEKMEEEAVATRVNEDGLYMCSEPNCSRVFKLESRMKAHLKLDHVWYECPNENCKHRFTKRHLKTQARIMFVGNKKEITCNRPRCRGTIMIERYRDTWNSRKPIA